MYLCSQQLLKQISDLEASGEHKGGGRDGGMDANLREKVSLFRLSTDAVVKVKCFNNAYSLSTSVHQTPDMY